MVRISPDDAEQIEAIAALHAELLPTSTPARFGHRFMTEFYFTTLVREGLLLADLFRHDGVYAGFNVYTPAPESFVRDGIRRHPFSLAALVLRLLLESPGRTLGALWDLLVKSRGMPRGKAEDTAFWLTFGVKEPFTKVRLEPDGRRISGALVAEMIQKLRELGVHRLQGTVAVDNKPALFFSHAFGFRVVASAQAMEGHHLLELDLAADPAAAGS